MRSFPGELGGRSISNRAVTFPVVFKAHSGALTIPVRQCHPVPIAPGDREEISHQSLRKPGPFQSMAVWEPPLVLRTREHAYLQRWRQFTMTRPQEQRRGHGKDWDWRGEQGLWHGGLCKPRSGIRSCAKPLKDLNLELVRFVYILETYFAKNRNKKSVYDA